jgi:hypothetical protein
MALWVKSCGKWEEGTSHPSMGNTINQLRSLGTKNQLPVKNSKLYKDFNTIKEKLIYLFYIDVFVNIFVLQFKIGNICGIQDTFL